MWQAESGTNHSGGRGRGDERSARCNIGARGRLVRLVSGLITLMVGLGLAGVLVFGGLEGAGWWAVAGAAVAATAGGGFQIYEGWAGWCVLRAMGFWTPI